MIGRTLNLIDDAALNRVGVEVAGLFGVLTALVKIGVWKVGVVKIGSGVSNADD